MLSCVPLQSKDHIIEFFGITEQKTKQKRQNQQKSGIVETGAELPYRNWGTLNKMVQDS